MKVLDYFPYRRGYVRGNPMKLPRESMKSLEETLAKMYGLRTDNHVCYLVQIQSFPKDVVKGIMFTDSNCIIGDRVDAERW
jgi:hypothetical protein